LTTETIIQVQIPFLGQTEAMLLFRAIQLAMLNGNLFEIKILIVRRQRQGGSNCRKTYTESNAYIAKRSFLLK
jgi:hypothetical protein